MSKAQNYSNNSTEVEGKYTLAFIASTIRIVVVVKARNANKGTHIPLIDISKAKSLLLNKIWLTVSNYLI